MFDSCINAALYTIFHVDHEHSLLLGEYLNVSILKSSMEKRRDRFMKNLLMMSDYKPVSEAYARGICDSLE